MKVGKDGMGKIGRRGMRWVLGWVCGVWDGDGWGGKGVDG